jgi:hypothetical protein
VLDEAAPDEAGPDELAEPAEQAVAAASSAALPRPRVKRVIPRLM